MNYDSKHWHGAGSVEIEFRDGHVETYVLMPVPKGAFVMSTSRVQSDGEFLHVRQHERDIWIRISEVARLSVKEIGD